MSSTCPSPALPSPLSYPPSATLIVTSYFFIISFYVSLCIVYCGYLVLSVYLVLIKRVYVYLKIVTHLNSWGGKFHELSVKLELRIALRIDNPNVWKWNF